MGRTHPRPTGIMFYYIAKLIWLLLQPSNLLLIAIGGGAGLLLWGRRRAAGWLIVPAAVVLLLTSILPVGQWLLLPLENRFPQTDSPPVVDGIVVLGGSVDLDISAARETVALQDAAERYTALIELGRRFPEARLVFSGGAEWLADTDLKAAEAMRAFCRRQGFPCARILFESRSRNTHENALFARDLAEPGTGETWLLVTSAAHMPRSVGIFRQIGWDMVAWPVDYQTAGFSWLTHLNTSRRLGELDLAVKHWLGLLAYWLTGRTDSLFPGP